MGHDYSYTQPSSSRATPSSEYDVFSSVEKRMSRPGKFGIPERCSCGLPAVTLTSTTESNPGRVFYGCRNHKDGRFHLFKWWDEAMTEELQDLRSSLENQGECIQTMEKGPRHHLVAYSGCLLRVETEVTALKEVVLKRLEQIEKMKKVAIVVTTISVIIGLISFLFAFLV